MSFPSSHPLFKNICICEVVSLVVCLSVTSMTLWEAPPTVRREITQWSNALIAYNVCGETLHTSKPHIILRRTQDYWYHTPSFFFTFEKNCIGSCEWVMWWRTENNIEWWCEWPKNLMIPSISSASFQCIKCKRITLAFNQRGGIFFCWWDFFNGKNCLMKCFWSVTTFRPGRNKWYFMLVKCNFYKKL